MANPDKQKAMAKKLEEGKFALRDWREQLSTLMNMYVSYPRFAAPDTTLTLHPQGLAIQNHVFHPRPIGRDGGCL